MPQREGRLHKNGTIVQAVMQEVSRARLDNENRTMLSIQTVVALCSKAALASRWAFQVVLLDEADSKEKTQDEVRAQCR